MNGLLENYKPVLYTAGGIGIFVASEVLYHYFVRKPKYRKEKEVEVNEIDEIFYVKQPFDMNTALTSQMKFGRAYDYHLDVLLHLIQSAQKSLRVMMYLCSSQKLAEALIDAHKRGVQVFVVFDASMEFGPKNSQVQALHLAGVNVRKFVSTAQVTMHHKICLIDVPYNERQDKLLPEQYSPPQYFKPPVKLPKETGVVIGGSLNWTCAALTKNYESYYVRSKAENCLKAAREFFSVWNDSVPIL